MRLFSRIIAKHKYKKVMRHMERVLEEGMVLYERNEKRLQLMEELLEKAKQQEQDVKNNEQ